MVTDDVEPGDIPPSDEDTRDLDDITDRNELRTRYYGLLQELRVVLPGVQVLLAFLLTAPFASKFDQLDGWGRRAYEAALTSSMLSVAFLLSPTFLHRFGQRTARRDRLLWSIRLMVVGLVMLAVSLLTAMWGVARFVFDTTRAWELAVPVGVTMVVLWIVVPLHLHRRGSRSAQKVTDIP